MSDDDLLDHMSPELQRLYRKVNESPPARETQPAPQDRPAPEESEGDPEPSHYEPVADEGAAQRGDAWEDSTKGKLIAPVAEAKGETQPPTVWDAPIPLGALAEAEVFPLDVLPVPLRRFMEDVSAAMNCPADYSSVPLLVVAGAAIGASRALEIKHGWTERPSFYAAVVGEPGCAKTPAQKIVAAPLIAEQTRLHETFRRALKAHKAGVDDVRPIEQIRYVSDVTVEKLSMILQENTRGACALRDEITAWVDGMDAYKKKGADKQFYLSVWAGDPVSVHRKNQEDGSVFVPHPFLSVVGGLPPDLLPKLRGEKAVSDGFLDRILFAFPKPPKAKGETWNCVADESSTAWRETLSALWALQMETSEDHEPRPRFVRLTSCGRRAWERFTTGLADELNGDSFVECLRGPWSKFRIYCARLALVIHYLRLLHGETDGEDVDGQSLDRAAALVRYFQSQARKVYAAMGADEKIADAQRLLKRLPSFVKTVNCVSREGGVKVVTKRDIHAGVWGGTKRAEEVEGIIGVLEKHGYIKVIKRDRVSSIGRLPSSCYELHPSLLAPESSVFHSSQNSQNTQKETGNG